MVTTLGLHSALISRQNNSNSHMQTITRQEL